MEKYIRMEEEFEGQRIDRVFTTDFIQLNLFVMNTVELIKESEESPAFNVGIGGSIYGDPIVHKDVLYFGSCDKNLYAVSLDGKELWRFQTNHVVSSPNIYEDRIYVGSFDGNLYCIGLDGKLIWKYETKDKILSKPVIHKGVVYFGSKDGNLYAVSTEGKLVWKFRTGGPVGADPFVYNDLVFFGSRDQKAYALTLDGKLKWSFSTGGLVTGSYADSSGVYFSSYDKNFYCLDHNGRKKWSFKVPQRNVRPPLCYNDILYFICLDGNLYAVKKDGKLLWKFPTQSSVFSLPCFDKENVYLGSSDFNVYCIDQQTGREKWRFACGGPIATNLTMKENLIFIGGWDCKMYAINTKGELVWAFPTSLSYVAPVYVETKPEVAKTFQVVWEGDRKSEEKYKAKEGTIDIGGYKIFSSYIDTSSDYTGGKKKRYA